MTGRFFPVQTIHLGKVGTFAGFNESALPIGGHLGVVIEDNGKVYRLVKHNDGTADVATVAGGVCHWKDRDNFEVTSDQTDAQAGVNGIAGAYLGVITHGYYCFVQIGGKQSLKTAAAVVAGDKLIGSTTDLQLARIAAGVATTDECVAIAYGAVSGGSSTAYWILGMML